MSKISPKIIDVDRCRIEASLEDVKNLKAFGTMPESKVGDGGYDRPWMKDKESILKKQNDAIEKMKQLGRFPTQLFTNIEHEKYKYIKRI